MSAQEMALDPDAHVHALLRNGKNGKGDLGGVRESRMRCRGIEPVRGVSCAWLMAFRG